MSRKLVLSLAAAAVVAGSIHSDEAFARSFGRGGLGHGGAHFVGATRMVGSGHYGHLSHFHPHPIPILYPGKPGHPHHPGHPTHPPSWVWWHHHHHHWVFRGGRWIIIDDVAVVDTPVAVATPVASTPAPGLCSCLTKTYTPTGLVVFADVCTKEAAEVQVGDPMADAAPTSGAAAANADPQQASGETTGPGPVLNATQVPTAPNYAGRTFADYLAANPQAAAQFEAAAQAAQAAKKN
ncbi:MAG TPA: hypothetical protein VKV77_01965 [Methylovirgula sp.]|nr:hypothetical protein [Methylovirgula sp.]